MELNFENKSTKDLEDTLKVMKAVAITLSIVILLLLSICVYGLVTKENKTTFIALFVVGVSCGAMLPIQISSMNKIKTEIESRKQ
ncbi:hypothetical protein [Polaribacter sp. R77954]|uniref:hypothetical protein n=1 Tax=Polaribacter sp. R77954 TaxID=3093870 RepID=UPI0037C6078A